MVVIAPYVNLSFSDVFQIFLICSKVTKRELSGGEVEKNKIVQQLEEGISKLKKNVVLWI